MEIMHDATEILFQPFLAVEQNVCVNFCATLNDKHRNYKYIFFITNILLDTQKIHVNFTIFCAG